MNEQALAEEAFKRAVEHLGLVGRPIELKMVRRLKGLGSCTTYLDCFFYIKICKGQPPARLLNTVAHEVRHAWHRVSGVLSRQNDGTWVWAGTEFVPERKVYRRLAYHYEPDEADCRAYARWFTRTFYRCDSYEPEVQTERLRDLFLDG